MTMKQLKEVFDVIKDKLIIFLTPMLFLPLVFVPGTPESKCLFVVLVMAIYWLFEVLPLAVTALLPVVLYPALGILSADKTCKSYMPDVNFLSFGGLVVALAVEKCNLHQRIALRVLTWVGSEPKWIMLGFMSITGFLSMWMSNTAATAMMVPIAQSVIQEWKTGHDEEDVPLEKQPLDDQKVPPESINLTSPSGSKNTMAAAIRASNIAKGLLISICFASSLGGTATLTGTPTNLAMVGLMKSLFPLDGGRSVTYVFWMLFALPVTIVSLILTWFIMQFYFLGFMETIRSFRRSNKKGKEDKISQMMAERYANLPPVSYAEISVVVLFGILLFMWIFRDLGTQGFSGFGMLFKPGYFTDGTSAVLISVLLFILPDRKISLRGTGGKGQTPVGTLMDWATMKKKFPWNVVLLLGGGFALAAGVKDSGLSVAIGNLLSKIGGIPVFALQIVCMTLAIVMTNIASNVVVASILIPIVSTLAQNAHVNPLALILPTTLACSYAFLLPAGTPPNAIVFGPGELKLKDMVGSGIYVSILCTILVVLHCHTLARAFVDFGTYPFWAEVGNETVTVATQLTTVVTQLNGTTAALL